MRLRSLVYLAAVLVVVAAVPFGLNDSTRIATAQEAGVANVAPEPPPGGLTQVLAGTSDIEALIDAQTFDIESIWKFDIATQKWTNYIVGAPAFANTLTSLDPAAIVTIKAAPLPPEHETATPFITAVVTPEGNQIVLGWWPVGEEVKAELRSADGAIVERWAGIVIGGDEFTVFPLGPDIFEPGQTLSVALGSLRKEVTIVGIEIVGDVEANAVVGHAPAGTAVLISANCSDPTTCSQQEVLADADGRFSLDLDGRTSLEPGSDISAGVRDVQGDRVVAGNTAG